MLFLWASASIFKITHQLSWILTDVHRNELHIYIYSESGLDSVYLSHTKTTTASVTVTANSYLKTKFSYSEGLPLSHRLPSNAICLS